MLKIEDLLSGSEKICVVGLGYVGLPLAVSFSRHFNVVGFDINKKRIEELKRGIDSSFEVSEEELRKAKVFFSSDPEIIKGCKFIIVAVPTPVDKLKNPDLAFLRGASTIVGKNLQKGSVIVYESTVFPGATEEICIPILEKESKMVWKRDFWVGYSPERVNPGDKNHGLDKVIKVVAGDTQETLELISQVYSKVCLAGVYKASSIRTAEAAKVIENIQRDINIALINELALIFHKLNLDTREVLKAAETKWNFIKFEPGLVGGHCIPVDPYYLAYKALEAGHMPELILSGRRVNESIPRYIAHEIVKLIINANKPVKDAKALVLGITFKENVPDIRNSKVFDMIEELRSYSIKVFVYDPVAKKEEVSEEYGIDLIEDIEGFSPYEAVILAVKHREFLENLSLSYLKGVLTEPPILIDVKGVFEKEDAQREGFIYWRL
ncbi:MAG: nucleotide sugar dehydrogenase [Synergistetes bacterium]|nr:nucleotide sugar dehydrogenase [Synergistota bacterium]MCX8128201.1 nucleotide sugar dehydrogenase [Synergistota bacterium]MDW8192720.1 nucleotide sugar dehydrogenase [Synergistota bacterium]